MVTFSLGLEMMIGYIYIHTVMIDVISCEHTYILYTFDRT